MVGKIEEMSKGRGGRVADTSSVEVLFTDMVSHCCMTMLLGYFSTFQFQSLDSREHKVNQKLTIQSSLVISLDAPTELFCFFLYFSKTRARNHDENWRAALHL